MHALTPIKGNVPSRPSLDLFVTPGARFKGQCVDLIQRVCASQLDDSSPAGVGDFRNFLHLEFQPRTPGSPHRMSHRSRR
jgi:hypothetical protein